MMDPLCTSAGVSKGLFLVVSFKRETEIMRHIRNRRRELESVLNEWVPTSQDQVPLDLPYTYTLEFFGILLNVPIAFFLFLLFFQSLSSPWCPAPSKWARRRKDGIFVFSSCFLLKSLLIARKLLGNWILFLLQLDYSPDAPSKASRHPPRRFYSMYKVSPVTVHNNTSDSS